MSEAERPAEKANPVCVTYNSKGTLTLASVDKGGSKHKLSTT